MRQRSGESNGLCFLLAAFIKTRALRSYIIFSWTNLTGVIRIFKMYVTDTIKPPQGRYDSPES